MALTRRIGLFIEMSTRVKGAIPAGVLQFCICCRLFLHPGTGWIIIEIGAPRKPC